MTEKKLASHVPTGTAELILVYSSLNAVIRYAFTPASSRAAHWQSTGTVVTTISRSISSLWSSRPRPFVLLMVYSGMNALSVSTKFAGSEGTLFFYLIFVHSFDIRSLGIFVKILMILIP